MVWPSAGALSVGSGEPWRVFEERMPRPVGLGRRASLWEAAYGVVVGGGRGIGAQREHPARDGAQGEPFFVPARPEVDPWLHLDLLHDHGQVTQFL